MPEDSLTLFIIEFDQLKLDVTLKRPSTNMTSHVIQFLVK
jgi:hypothetical protein